MRTITSFVALTAVLSIASAACALTAPTETGGAAATDGASTSPAYGSDGGAPEGAGSGADGGPGVEPAACTGSGPLLTIPVRVHLLSSDVASLNATIAAAEVPTLFGAANALWSPACITFTVESTISETVSPEGGAGFEAAVASSDTPALVTALEKLMSRQTMLERGVDVFVIKSFGIKALGRFFGNMDAIVWADTRSTGERTDPLVLAHELGHAMGLAHYTGDAEATNLMQSGGADITKARSLTPDQIAAARAQAATGDAH